MSDFLNFGKPNYRTVKTEKYPDMGVVTIISWGGKGKNRRIEFNKKAIELLNIDLENKDTRISFSFPAGTTKIGVANIISLPNADEIGVTIAKTNKSVSDKGFYELIKKTLGFDKLEENGPNIELKLDTVEARIGENDVYLLTVLGTCNAETEETTETTEEEVVVEAQDEEVIEQTQEEPQVEETVVEAQVVEEVAQPVEVVEAVEETPAADSNIPDFLK